MLAYVFWHVPADGVERAGYESALMRFHRSLARRPPAGFVGSVCFRAGGLAWLPAPDGYEDWYVVEDFAALGVLNEAAIARGHISAHDAAARLAGPGAAGVYRLLEGSPDPSSARVAVWIEKPRGIESPVLGALLGDGIDESAGSLWQRQLVLGPAAEYCVLAQERPAGVAPTRLGRGWSAASAVREAL
jgi:hypothetical protein